MIGKRIKSKILSEEDYNDISSGEEQLLQDQEYEKL
jgi:hypothetical protein